MDALAVVSGIMDSLMSVNLSADNIELGESRSIDRSVMQIATCWEMDRRITELLPRFDAPFFQAGLAGYSDAAMRLVARHHGCPYCVTEALLDTTLISGGKGRTREDPDLLAAECGLGDPVHNRLGGLDDHPVAGQIMGSEPETMAKAAHLLIDMNYDVVDVNLACPVKKIRKRRRGGHFLAASDEAIAVLQAVYDAVDKRRPVTVKIRRAFEDSPEMERHFERIFNAAYEIGYAWATVHCRTVVQKYVGPGRWTALRELVQRYPDRVIFGSGDIWEAKDIFHMLEYTGVHAVSVARGCIGNPWIFQQARSLMKGRTVDQPSIAEQREALLDHFTVSQRLHGDALASKLMRKFGIKFSQHHPNADQVKKAFIECSSGAQWLKVINAHYPETVS